VGLQKDDEKGRMYRRPTLPTLLIEIGWGGFSKKSPNIFSPSLLKIEKICNHFVKIKDNWICL
jgi:hypothetical protein